MSTLTPVGARLQMALDAEYLRMQNEWFFKWHHIGADSVVEIDGFDGSMIRYGGIKFSGTARDVYWSTIQRYARQKVGQLFGQGHVGEGQRNGRTPEHPGAGLCRPDHHVRRRPAARARRSLSAVPTIWASRGLRGGRPELHDGHSRH